MDDLKSIFKDHHSETSIPPDGHEQRFRSKLEHKFPSSGKRTLMITLMSYAAAVFIGLILFLSILETNKTIEEKTILTLETPETIEDEVYLQAQVESRMDSIYLLDRSLKHTAALMHDIQEFDNSLNNLKDDLKEAPGDQRIVEAVINTYLIKIETLDNVLFILQKIS